MKKLILIFFAAIYFLSACTTKPKPKTIENLKAAYKLELEESAKYAAFAKKTRDEGMGRLAVLFQTVSKANKVYAYNCRNELEKLGVKPDSISPVFQVKSTIDNLNDAIKNETDKFTEIYPQYIDEAHKEKALEASKVFEWIKNSKMDRSVFYVDAIQSIQNKTTNAFYTLYLICPVCGSIYYPVNAPDICSICGTNKQKFIPEG
jgi:rubrerythrin